MNGLRFPSGLQTVVVLAALLASSGCTAFANRVATQLAARQLTELADVTIIEGDVARLRNCLRLRGGTCEGTATTPVHTSLAAPPELAPLAGKMGEQLAASVDQLDADQPAKLAKQVLDHPFLSKIAALHNDLRGLETHTLVPGYTTQTDGQDITLSLSVGREEMRDFFDQVNRATAAGSWAALADHAHRQVQALAAASPTAAAQLRRDSRTAVYIREYLRAYFENGKFVQVELDTQQIRQQIASYLSEKLPWLCGTPNPAQECEAMAKLVDDVLRGVRQDPANNHFIFVALGTGGFVTRDGRAFAFPGFQITLDPGGSHPVSVKKMDYVQVGTELVMVFLQAVFDAHEALPGVSSATGAQLPAPYEAWSLPVFDPSAGNVDADDFRQINTIANRVDAAVSTAVDRAIRGAGPFSLNNEAIEELVVAAIGVTVRKISEKAAWCWYACDLDTRLSKAIDAKVERIRLKLRIE